MRKIIAALALAVAAPAFAQAAAPVAPAPADATPVAASAVKNGAPLKDASGVRLGNIDKVRADAAGNVAAVQIIFAQGFRTIPGNTLSLKDGSLYTSLTKSQVNKLD